MPETASGGRPVDGAWKCVSRSGRGGAALWESPVRSALWSHRARFGGALTAVAG